MSALQNVERRVGQTARRFFSPAPRLHRPGLTGVRALAALLVLAFHLNAFSRPERLLVGMAPFQLDLTPLVTIGWVGVDVFFVLSGFLITAHLVERFGQGHPPTIWPRYMADRVLRVVPAYWAQIAVLLAVAWLAAGSAPDWTRYVPAHLAFLQNFSVPGHSAINGIYWSLPVEFAFYLVAPWMVAAAWRGGGDRPRLARRAAALVALAVACSVLWRVGSAARAGSGNVPLLFWMSATHLPGCIEQFAIGSAAALLFLAGGAPDATTEPGRAAGSNALVAGGLAALVAAMYLLDAQVERYWRPTALFYLWHTGVALAVAALVTGVAMRGPLARALFEPAAVLWLGTISYSLYLWHPILAARLSGASDAAAGGLGAFALLAVPPIIAASAASYYLVERPFLRLQRGAAARPGKLQ